MNRKHWRETVEIVGIVSIVTALLLVAWEIHRANRIAQAHLTLKLEQNLAAFHGNRAVTPDYARLFPKLSLPEGHLITATEASQIQGIVLQMVAAYRSVQTAYDNGLLDEARFAAFTSELARTIEEYPGLEPYLRAVYDADPDMARMPAFKAILDLMAE